MSDSDTRIKDLPLASTVANDDYIAIDGVANDTRRYKVKDITDSVDAVAGAISEVVDESGTAVAMSMNGSTYVVTVQLKNAAGTVVSSGTVDLPFENTITSGSYSNETLTLTKMGGSTVSIDLSSLSGKAEIMTESEWDDLPDSKLTDGKVYALSGVSPSTQDNPLWQKLGFASLDTTADDCSDAINELNTGLTTLNSNKANKQWTRILQVDITSNTDQTVQVTYPDGYSELLFSIQRNDNGRTIGTTLVPKDQFNGGACYVSGSYTIESLAMNQNAHEYVNGVFIYASANSIEVAFNKGSVNLRARVFAR